MSRQGRHDVIISGYYGFDNLGDDAILEELIDELTQLMPKENIVVLSNQPEKTVKLFGVKAINRWQTGELFKALGQARLFISGGGGLFQDVENLRSIIYYGGQIVLAKMLGVPTFIFAQGIGPLKSNWAKTLTQSAMKQSETIAIRDAKSQALLKSWQIESELTADPVWSLGKTVEKNQSTNEKLSLPRENDHTLLVGLSLRPSPNFDQSHSDCLAEVLKESLPANHSIVLIAMQNDQDLPVLNTFLARLNELGLKAQIADGSAFQKPSDWLSLMGELDLVIGMRLHALILALKQGKPVVGIEYDPKVENLMEQFEQPRLSLSLPFDQEKKGDWLKTVKEAVQSRQTFSQTGQEHLSSMEKMSCKNFDILAKILGSGSIRHLA